MRRRRSTWTPAPAPEPGQVLPALIIMAIALGVLAMLYPYLVWGNHG